MKNYGLGSLMSIPAGATPSPFQFATLKDVSLDMGGDLDELRGEKFFAIDAAKKNGKIGGKIKVCQLDPDVIATVIPGVTKTVGTQRGIRDESATVPAPSGPYTVTVAGSGSTFTIDNSLMTTATPMGMYLFNVAGGQNTMVRLPAIHIPKLGFGLKAEGWAEYDLDYTAVADANGKVAYIYSDEA
jgi:hypothetical protein